MRKHYTRGVNDKRRPSSIDPRGHWKVLAGLVRASASTLGFDVTCRFISVCNRQDVAGYLSLVSELEGDNSLYSPERSVQYVRTVRQLCALLKKFPFDESETDTDTRAVALEKALSAERQCRATNLRIANTPREELPGFISRARLLIEDVLGDLEPSKVRKILNLGKHGPGQSLCTKGDRVTDFYKFWDLPYTVSKRAAPYAFAAISDDPQWMDFLESSGRRTCVPDPRAERWVTELMLLTHCVEIVDEDRVTFVPKDARTDRPIAIGARMNVYLQLGVNEYLTRRLKRFGVDLTDQTRNQVLAKQGSRYCTLNGLNNPAQFSTIDLASASDTISRELVRLLLPAEWYAFLDDLRHDKGEIDGQPLIYEKFSAMGNGFTFSLESLIFWAVAKAATQEAGIPCTTNDIAVFGDDIIVREKTTSHVIDALLWCGFSVNDEKSFITGPFKESCGADYFKGTDVRPIYLKKRLDTYESVYYLCNSISRRLMAGRGYRGLYAGFTAALALLDKRYITYHPLPKVNAEGTLDSFSNDLGLEVPLAYMRQHGLNPWLSTREREYLIMRGLLDKNSDPTLPVYIKTTISAKQFRGYSKVRYYMALRQKGTDSANPFMRVEDQVLKLASASGIVTRRNAVTRHRSVQIAHRWDNAHGREVLRHPLNWF